MYDEYINLKGDIQDGNIFVKAAKKAGLGR